MILNSYAIIFSEFKVTYKKRPSINKNAKIITMLFQFVPVGGIEFGASPSGTIGVAPTVEDVPGFSRSSTLFFLNLR